MYNVLFVDDEQEIRTGLRLKMDWSGLGFQVAGEANNGQEALDRLDESDYHLMITDIKMPVMGGLELLKRASAKFPYLKVIVLSGFDDFHFVKAALQCGARDYLLKPVVRSELREIIEKIRGELDEEIVKEWEHRDVQRQLQQSMSAAKEQLMLALISDEGEDHLLPLRSDIATLQFKPFSRDNVRLRFLCVEMRLPEGRVAEAEGSRGLLRLAFQMVCREIAQHDAFEEHVFAFHHPSYPNMMHYLLFTDTEEQEERVLSALIAQIHASLHGHLRVETVIAVGDAVRELTAVRQAFVSSFVKWSRSQAGAVTQTIMVKPGANTSDPLQPELEKRLLLLLDEGELERFVQAIALPLQMCGISLQEIHSFMLRVVFILHQALTKNGLELEQTQDWLFPITQWKFTTPQAAAEYLEELASFAIARMKRSRTSGGAAVVETVRQYIDSQYMNEISLSMLADRFHINTTYLSELFKKQIGTTFSDYLIQVRIGKAEELLADPNLRLADIAELVGFANSSYLSSVFKKMYGVSPNEYRNRSIGAPTR
ncbi:two-component system response regulator YesN [Paenibacillus taihuensis]|uniref:Two-component system response regulator YesN n=1 Tax=Paenibacillus taihuensis TaxID=1156355 RepID=A0A3D9SCE1_9BACL|nr:response regulator [Paenibacillus taihuensis]REE90635.1 two-component system response regulator YesN [Paenibacillus taihuensis]